MFESKELRKIFDAELARGNEVAEDSAWPPKCQKLVILKRRFHMVYETKTLAFKQLEDPHYWYAEYSTIDGAECLACK